MGTTLSAPDIKRTVENSFTGAEIVDFARAFREKVGLGLEGKQIGGSRALSEGIIPSFVETSKYIAEQAYPFIPKDPFEAILWAVTSIRLTGAKQALDRYEGYPKEIEKLLPLAKGEPIKVSKGDMKDVGETLGRLLANHALAGRRLIQLKPELGDLGTKRSKLFEAGKMDELHLLDTILQTLSKRQSKKQQ